MRLSKYFATIKVSWENGFVYRLNFIMWRVRSVIQLLVIYFLWLSIFKDGGMLGDYTRQSILAYILGSAVLRSFVLSSRSIDIAREIATGDLNNFLIKPMNYFTNWLSRDFADKTLNFLFVCFELTIIIVILKPPLFIQHQIFYLAAFIIASLTAMLIYFFLSFLISSVTFWYPEHNGWPLRFFSTVIIEFVSGGLFPLDIFPKSVFNFLQILPPAYFIFHPMQIYLGRLSVVEATFTLMEMFLWLGILAVISRHIWNKGLKVYGAYGR